MCKVPEEICEKILMMERADTEITRRLRESGELQKYGYHPRLKVLHSQNGAALQKIIERYGFPTRSGCGERVYLAAWLIVQHDIGAPDFMRMCRDLFEGYSREEVALRERAYLQDRIAFYERRPQRFGTQFDYNLHGEMEVWWLEDKSKVAVWREQAGLPPLEEALRAFDSYPRVSEETAKAMRREQEDWLMQTGWCTRRDIEKYYLLCGK